MKNWIVNVEQKKKSNSVSERTKRRNKAAGIEIKKKNNKTLNNTIKYLLNDKHSNHAMTNIIDLGNARLVRDRIFDEVEYLREKKSVGVSNIASSFVLVLPADLYHPSKNEWNDIYNRTIENFTRLVNSDFEKKQKELLKKDILKMSERQKKEHELNKNRFSQRLSANDLKYLSTAVIHDDRNKPLVVGKTNGSHLNIVMSNVVNSEVIKYFTQKGGLEAMKKAYTQAVKETLNLDCNLYVPYESRPNDNKLNNFYLGETDLKLVNITENTPHKDLVVRSVATNKNKPLWLTKKEKFIHEQNQTRVVNKKIKQFKEQLPKAKKLISTANKAINAKNEALRVTNDAKSQLSTVQKELKESEIIIQKNQNYFLNIIRSDFVKDYLNGLKNITNSVLFYNLAKKFVRDLEDENKKYFERVKNQNPEYIEYENEQRIKAAEELKHRKENRFSGLEFEEDVPSIEIKIEKEKNTFKKKLRKLFFE